VRHCICRELPAKVEINQFNRNRSHGGWRLERLMMERIDGLTSGQSFGS
jgi:hypothetical protein